MSTTKLAAEVLGTYVLVLGGTAAILSAAAGGAPTNIVIVAFAFGLSLMAGLYAFGEVSGGHFNPAVSLAMVLDKRMDAGTMAGYWVAQVVGALLASLTLLIATSTDAVASTMTTFPNLETWEAFMFEAVFTAIFLAVILKVTTSANGATTAFLSIGLTLTMIHLVLIPFTGTSVNPVRSLGPAIIGGAFNADQIVYLVAPLVGAAAGWGLYKLVTSGADD